MNLLPEQIEKNKHLFLGLIRQIKIEGADINGLIEFLTNSDFFTAPASTIYHGNFEGGLCYHSLNVFDALLDLAEKYTPGRYDRNSLLVVGLLHDLSKTNFYEKYIMNKKVYLPSGTKQDNQGRFDWFAEEAYKVKNAKERFIGGDHATNSMFLISKYIPLTYEESVAVINHHFTTETNGLLKDITPIYNKYSLATLIHLADMIAVYLIENK